MGCHPTQRYRVLNKNVLLKSIKKKVKTDTETMLFQWWLQQQFNKHIMATNFYFKYIWEAYRTIKLKDYNIKTHNVTE